MKLSFNKDGMSAMYVGIGNISGQAIAFIFITLLARFLTQTEYGEVQYIINISMMAAVIVSAGLPAAMTRFLAKSKDDEQLMITYYSNITLIFIVMLILTELAVLLIFGIESYTFIVVLGYSVVMFYTAVVRGQMAYLKYSIITVLTNIIKILLLVALFYFVGVTTFSVLLIYSFSGWIGILFLEIIWPSRLHFQKQSLSPDTRKEILLFSGPVLMTTLTYSAVGIIPIITLEKFWNYDDIAVYSIAQLITTIYTFVPLALLTIAMPKISSLIDQKSRLHVFRQTTGLIITSSLILFAIIFIFGRWAIDIVFTDIYVASFIPLIILSIGAVFNGIRNSFSALWEGGGRPIYSTYDSVAGVIVSFAFCFILVPEMGIIGAAWGFTFGWIAAVIVDVYFYMRVKNAHVELK